MAQQKVLNNQLANGLTGEFYSNQPQRTRSANLNSASAAHNVVGRVVRYQLDDKNTVGVAHGGAVAGILGLPKSLVRNTLSNVKTLDNGQVVEVIQQGYVFVTLLKKDNARAYIGDWVYFNDKDGTLTAYAPTQVKGTGYTRLQGATIQVMHIDLPNNNDAPAQAIIYIDLAGDNSTKDA